MVLDGLRLGFTTVPLYSLVFHCRAIGGELQAHPLETSDVGWFARDALPTPLAGYDQWGDMAFRAIDGEDLPVWYDEPRPHTWRPSSLVEVSGPERRDRPDRAASSSSTSIATTPPTTADRITGTVSRRPRSPSAATPRFERTGSQPNTAGGSTTRCAAMNPARISGA